MNGHDLVMMAVGMGLLMGVSLLIVGALVWVEEREHRRDMQQARGRRPARDIGQSCDLCGRSILDGPTHYSLFHNPRRPLSAEDTLPEGWRADDWDV